MPYKDPQQKREWAAANRAAVNEANRRWRQRNPGTSQRPSNPAYRRGWYERNAEQERERERARHAAHRNTLNAERAERRRKQLEREPDAVRARDRDSTRRRRARLREAVIGDPVLLGTYDAVLRHDPCCYCGADSEHADHVVPLHGGGDHDWTNLTAACRSCNGRKGTRSLLAFMLVIA
jgi:5-methylcytosine-specific restriction endonuclease McrA